ncbi:MAG: lytic transglycosylase domain-containing protein [Acidobacteriota bacterium]
MKSDRLEQRAKKVPRWLLAPLLLLFPASLQAQKIYSYVDADGVKVYTNKGGDRSAEAASLPVSAPKALKPRPLPRSDRYEGLIHKIAGQYGEDAQLVKAIIRVESAFDPQAVSSKNCKGLMQLHPDTARRFGVKDVFDPADNIKGGVKYLQHLRRNFDDIELILAAYNAGENAVLRHDGIPPYRETRSYVKKVLKIYDPRQFESPSAQRRPRVYRVVLPDGRILLTNVPSREVERKAQGKRSRYSRAIQVNLSGGN